MSERVGKRDLLALARNAAAPDALSAQSRQRRFGDIHDHVVAPGQIWRAAWDDVSVLVLVCGVHNSDIDIIPVTVDPGAEDSQAVVVESAATAFGVRATFWTGLRTELPLRVLDEIIDQLAAPLAEWIASPKSPRVENVSAVARVGRDPVTAVESCVTLRAEVEDDLSWLHAAPGLPVADDTGLTPTLASILGKSVDLRTLLSGLRHLGFDQSEVMTLLHGKRAVTPEEAEVIAAITNVDPARVAEAVKPLPAAFVAEVDHPRWRPVWRERAERDRTDETSARLKAGYEMYARAARQTGERTPDWTARLAQFRQFYREPPPS